MSVPHELLLTRGEGPPRLANTHARAATGLPSYLEDDGLVRRLLDVAHRAPGGQHRSSTHEERQPLERRRGTERSWLRWQSSV